MVPLGEVTSQALPPPPGAAGSQPAQVAAAAAPAPHNATLSAPPVPLRLPESVTQVAPHPASLYVDIAGFGHADYAGLLQRRLAALGAEVVLDYAAPRDRAYRVRIGPLAGAANADATLARVIAQGFGDARIVAQ